MMLDVTDKKLLVLLQENSKQTTKAIAAELNLSVTAVFERIKKLEKNGTIEKYAAIIDRKKIEKNFTVLCQVKLVQHREEYISKFEKEILDFPEILECWHVSGDYDYILKICVKDMDDYRNFMVTKLTKMQHIASTTSAFSIKEVKNTTVIVP